MQHFKAFEEILEDATKVVHLMNELHLGVSIEDVHESIASYSEPMSNEGVVDIPEESQTPARVEDFDSERNLSSPHTIRKYNGTV